MFLSRIQLRLHHLRPEMLEKWHTTAPYASHQWLWQLFPEQDSRQFLFRQEAHGQFFVLSSVPPSAAHSLFQVETRPFQPQLTAGMRLDFQLRANPVITRNGKRCDVMMNAKHQAREAGVDKGQWRQQQYAAAQAWLEKQGEQHGFRLAEPKADDFALWAGETQTQESSLCVKSWQQHRVMRKSGEPPMIYSSVDYQGTLHIVDVAKFTQALFLGIGKSKALGCGMLMVKRAR
ncbi:MAG: type I-E CRISPR-associated protein Cas6/Cse3/CasE [Yokenella regensburgei]|jgi:CRISPR system Cascade subunit CasE|nr:type I-E CRISPR-associated protein Cas6/Cse3/CasE [Yokenella regensburgei]